MSFSCVLDRRGLRAFRSTLTCLAKIGHDVNLEATGDALLMRALAPSHAAFALVTMAKPFFQPGSFHSQPMPPTLPTASQPSSGSQSAVYLKCKVSLKQLLLVFRNSHTAHDLEIVLAAKENKMWCTMQVQGIKSRYGIPFESQSNILQADYHSSGADSYLIFKPQLFSKALDHFSQRMAEVTILIDPEPTEKERRQRALDRHPPGMPMVRLKNFDQNHAAHHAAGLSLLQESMNTESDIPQAQLEACHLADPSSGVELTFNVKEVRAFLSYCESLSEPPHDVRLRWIQTGQPIKLETRLRHGYQRDGAEPTPEGDPAIDDALHMQLVVATLAETQSHSQQPTPQPAATPDQRVGGGESTQQQQQAASQAFRQKQSAAGPNIQQNEGDEEAVPPTP